MSDTTLYNVKDASGNIYGPATIATLRDWFREGRIVAAMQIAPVGTTTWQSLAAHPGLADLLGGSRPADAAGAPAAAPAAAASVAAVETAAADKPASAAAPATAGATKPAAPASLAAGSSFFEQMKKEAPLALWGAITSTAGIVLCCGCGWILGLAGGVMGGIALSQLKPTADPRAKQTALAAIGLGVLALIVNCCGFTGMWWYTARF